MKYVFWTVIIFAIITILYGLCDSFKSYLLRKYRYEFYDDGIISSLAFSLIIGSLSIGLNSVGLPTAVFLVMLTIAVISLSIVLIGNIMNTAFLPGILVTILQALYVVYLIILIAIIEQQLKNIFSDNNNQKGVGKNG